MMRHGKIEELLAVYRSLDAEERGQVDEHVRTCSSCAARLAAYQEMDRALAELSSPAPSRYRRDALLNAIAEDGDTTWQLHHNRRSALDGLPLGISLAGLLLVGIAALLIARSALLSPSHDPWRANPVSWQVSPPSAPPVAVQTSQPEGSTAAAEFEAATPDAPPMPALGAPVEGWQVHRQPDIGLSFAYPPGAVVNQDSAMPPNYTVIVPASDFPDGNVVTFGIEGAYELPNGMALETWVMMRNAVGEWPIEVLSSYWTSLGGDGTNREGFMVETKGPGEVDYAVYLAHGNLVLKVTGPGTPAMARFLPEFASTIEIVDSAPKTLNELYGVRQDRPSLLDDYQKAIAARSATPALDLVARDATAAAQITPAPQATYSPEMQTQEAVYYQSLETATAVARLTPAPPTPTPMPTPTPIPAAQPGFARYQGSSDYPDQPLFEVTYELSQWDVPASNRSLLVHRRLPDCVVDLRAGGRMAAGPAVVDWPTLGSQQWKRTNWQGDHMVVYSMENQAFYVLIAVHYPVSNAQETAQACRLAAEAVLASFELLD